MEKRIPTLLGLILLAATVGIVAFLFEFFTRTISTASGTAEPNNVAFTNISDVAFTVSWATGNPATGVVEITSPGQKSLVAYDERDTAPPSKLNVYTGHSIPVSGLKPDTNYAVSILSGGKTYTNNGKPYVVHTGPVLSDSPGGLGPAYGTITTTSNFPATGALVYLTVEGGQRLSALVGKSGTWLIPLNLVRTSSLTQYLPTAGRLTETIKVVYSDQETNATTDTLNDSPVPAMEMGKTYDFRRQQGNIGKNELAQVSHPQVLGSETASRSTVVALTQPAEGAALPTNLPLFQGTGVPGALVSLVIGITSPISGTTTVSADGTWTFTPPKTLSPGLQSVTMTTVDTQGRAIALTHSFTILKSGTQVLGVATPSATLTPTLTPSLSPTLSATPSPTSTLAGQPVPTSGNSWPTILLILFGLIFLGSGAVVITR